MRRTDLRVLQSFYGDFELMQFITGKPRSPLETRARLKKDLGHHSTYGFGLCIAEWKEDRRAIGRCGLEPVEGATGLEGELAWMFSKPWWGKGLAAEAGAALLEFGLHELELTRIYATADPDNHASIRVMQQIGMSPAEPRGGDVVYEVRLDRRSAI